MCSGEGNVQPRWGRIREGKMLEGWRERDVGEGKQEDQSQEEQKGDGDRDWGRGEMVKQGSRDKLPSLLLKVSRGAG